MQEISGPSALDAWLDERDGFEDGHLDQVERSADGGVRLRLEQYARLGMRPGDISVVEVYELVAGAPIEFDAPSGHDPGDVLECVDMDDLDGRMVVRIELGSGPLRLVADHLTVEHLATVRRRTEPWVADEFTVVTGDAHDDRYWSGRVGEVLGTPVGWRILGDRQTGHRRMFPADAAPAGDDGLRRALPSARARFQRRADADAGLWQAMRIVAADFERVASGNCVFDSADWTAYLGTGEFPPDERLRGGLSD